MYKELEKYLKEEIFVKGNRIKLNNFIGYRIYKVLNEIFIENNMIYLDYILFKLMEIQEIYREDKYELKDYNKDYLELIFKEIKEGNYT